MAHWRKGSVRPHRASTTQHHTGKQHGLGDCLRIGSTSGLVQQQLHIALALKAAVFAVPQRAFDRGGLRTDNWTDSKPPFTSTCFWPPV